jgi:7-keto-8-aminopelargonate synthetase-like enzyme
MITSSDSKTARIHNGIFQLGLDVNAIQITLDDKALNGRLISVQKKDLINFGSCSYLGLELDESVKQAAIDAILKYGVHFSSSKIYASLCLYENLEDLLEQIFGSPVLVSSTTTLGHMSYLPNIINREDAVILDHQAHASVQNTSMLLKANGIHIEKIRHSNLEMLDYRISKLKYKYNKIWYLLDGVYSMYGDFAPAKALATLLEQHEQLHFYVDDAHGMSWAGQHGKGFYLNTVEKHPRVYLATSLGKGFGCAGGALIMPNNELKAKIKTLGSTFVFSGPVQPPLLGAMIASAKIHLTPEIKVLQKELMDRIVFFILKSKQFGLPIIDTSESPIFFIGCCKTTITTKLVCKLMDAGYFTNICAFPAVPLNRAGVRVTITRHQTFVDIENLVRLASESLREIVQNEDFSIEAIYEQFAVS